MNWIPVSSTGTTPKNNFRLDGIIALHVDDMACGGTNAFQENVIEKLRQIYPFKHCKKGQGKFLGRWLEQQEDGSIVSSQEEYAKNVQTVTISKERRKQKDDSLTTQEMHQFRGILGAANWLNGSTRPDLAAQTAILQQRVARATVDDLVAANQLVSKIRDFKHTKITYKSIPLDQGAILVTSDASWANTDDLGSQGAYMTLFADQRIQGSEWANVSPLRWKSWKLERKTQSTLGAELMSFSRAIAEGDWMRSLFAEARQHRYSLRDDKVCRQQLPMTAVVDNKPIYDHCLGDGIVVRDKRMAIDMLVVRADLRSQSIQIRWVDTRQMIVDSLTKVGASADFLFFVLRFGRYVCVCVKETESLEWKAQEKRQRAINASKKGCVKTLALG